MKIILEKIEKTTSLNELKKSGVVISLGGGAFLDKNIRKEIKNSAVSFWLDVEINVLLKRLRNTKKRPLLFKKNIRDTVNKIYLERKKTYSEADYRIRCSYLKPELIINKMLKLYENTKN